MMTSKERVLAAMRRQPVDRVPVSLGFWSGKPLDQAFNFDSLEDKLAWERELGLDSYVSLPLPFEGYGAALVNPDISQRTWREDDPAEKFPILCSEWTSPAGKLSAKLRQTPDYPFDTVNFFHDFNTPRFTKPLLATAEDMLTFVRMDPYRLGRDSWYFDWREKCREAKEIAARQGLAVAAGGGTSLDYLIWGSTAEQAIFLLLEHPAETMTLLEYLHAFSRQRLELCLNEGFDFAIRRGWYESADFWSPRHFAEFAAPFIRDEIELVHQAGAASVYLMCTGIAPMLPELAKLDFDCLLDPEPVCTGQDLRHIVAELGERKSFWTGVSAPLHLGRGSADEVRQAVREAYDIFGRRGFLLKAVPSIRRHWPWENVLAMLDEHRRLQPGNDQ